MCTKKGFTGLDALVALALVATVYSMTFGISLSLAGHDSLHAIMYSLISGAGILILATMSMQHGKQPGVSTITLCIRAWRRHYA